ncbi:MULTISPECIES: GvpL/GvpF family gas vesicle protein [Streptomyces]|uniref:Gas vesicle synthesis protein n=4 Tax=Streptomyces venezuelae TaxID=54571 RepID=F2R608_STRVP|nr:GvpL/GvpF family gas vesicle protein [Streptomyces venezuelae]APE19856.1 gas vesicle synthesis protein [Streptomyces venezuelae]QER97266.1 gas vesicle synthesis protein [Streptomyces venezuelae ATCC 10712]CCA53669.1 gas vesicle synthesis protein [Streptomyces venezuelae ATCC 10712]
MNAPSTAYVYGVGRDDGSLAGVVGTASGVDGHGVRLVAAGGLVALVSAVPEAAFDEAALQRRLEDLDLLEELARAHHAVVDAAFARAVVLPFRLATVYRDEDRVAEVLGGHRERFTELLGWLDGHVELGVKVHADPESAASLAGTAPQEPGGAAPAAGSGRAYLRQRMQRRRGTEDLYRAAGAVADEAAGVARQLARAAVVHRAQQGGLSGRQGVNIANHAYLVSADGEARFREEVEAVARSVPGVRVEVTGPWAPYSFAAPAPASAPAPAPASAPAPAPSGVTEGEGTVAR